MRNSEQDILEKLRHAHFDRLVKMCIDYAAYDPMLQSDAPSWVDSAFRLARNRRSGFHKSKEPLQWLIMACKAIADRALLERKADADCLESPLDPTADTSRQDIHMKVARWARMQRAADAIAKTADILMHEDHNNQDNDS